MVLLLCMIFLTAMMLLGLSASADTILQSQLAANLKQSEQVKQSAQTALETAEKWLMDQDNPLPAVCPPPCEQIAIVPADTLPANVQHEPMAWWLAHGQTLVENTASIPNDTNTSVWLIESAHTIPVEGNPDEQRTWYRILARGSDPADKVVSVVESLVLKTWPGEQQTPSAETAGPAPGGCRRVAWRTLR